VDSSVVAVATGGDVGDAGAGSAGEAVAIIDGGAVIDGLDVAPEQAARSRPVANVAIVR
jgi:hypothetical protein